MSGVVPSDVPDAVASGCRTLDEFLPVFAATVYPAKGHVASLSPAARKQRLLIMDSRERKELISYETLPVVGALPKTDESPKLGEVTSAAVEEKAAAAAGLA